MKKIIALLMVCGMCILPGTGRAQGIESGQSALSLYGGLGTAVQKSGVEVDGKNLSWGNLGAEIGLSYIYFPSSYFGIGADMRYAGFQGSKSMDEVPGWWHWHTFETDFNMNTFHLMGVGRININPGSQVRIYIPWGAGIAFAQGKMEYIWDEHVVDREIHWDTSFSWYAGLGVEFEQSDRLAWGIEARYNSFHYDYSGLAGPIGGKEIRNNPEHSYISLVIGLQFK